MAVPLLLCAVMPGFGSLGKQWCQREDLPWSPMGAEVLWGEWDGAGSHLASQHMDSQKLYPSLALGCTAHLTADCK